MQRGEHRLGVLERRLFRGALAFGDARDELVERHPLRLPASALASAFERWSQLVREGCGEIVDLAARDPLGERLENRLERALGSSAMRPSTSSPPTIRASATNTAWACRSAVAGSLASRSATRRTNSTASNRWASPRGSSQRVASLGSLRARSRAVPEEIRSLNVASVASAARSASAHDTAARCWIVVMKRS